MLRLVLALAVLVTLFVSTPAMAQVNDETVAEKTENVTPLPEAKPIAEYALAAGFLVVALGVGFFPSKRSHN